jgi:hypothetical protein
MTSVLLKIIFYKAGASKYSIKKAVNFLFISNKMHPVQQNQGVPDRLPLVGKIISIFHFKEGLFVEYMHQWTGPSYPVRRCNKRIKMVNKYISAG